ncbi:hypothetical protein K438DRAFT_1784869 [Mycena galopus ATCC 62051]|nr:hypothetical protein K438DRAFT_1784869 [Mycena galopus ATCC 62051]
MSYCCPTSLLTTWHKPAIDAAKALHSLHGRPPPHLWHAHLAHVSQQTVQHHEFTEGLSAPASSTSNAAGPTMMLCPTDSQSCARVPRHLPHCLVIAASGGIFRNELAYSTDAHLTGLVRLVRLGEEEPQLDMDRERSWSSGCCGGDPDVQLWKASERWWLGVGSKGAGREA